MLISLGPCRKFEEEQLKEFNAQQARAHLDRQKLWNSICVVNQERCVICLVVLNFFNLKISKAVLLCPRALEPISLTYKKRTQSVPQPVKFGEDPLSGFSRREPEERETFFQPGSMATASPISMKDKVRFPLLSFVSFSFFFESLAQLPLERSVGKVWEV